jgi:hypothetical protein
MDIDINLMNMQDLIKKLEDSRLNYSSMRCTTQTAQIMDTDTAETLFYHLYHNIEWEEGIKSKKGFTRLAKSLSIDDEVMAPIIPYLMEAIKKLKPQNVEQYAIVDTYLNLYENGDMWTPNHSHPKQHQIVISLGAERTLTVGKTNYKLKSGSAVIFGSSIHGVPKDPECHQPRISIATFMIPMREGEFPPPTPPRGNFPL